jgi:hypothetical protein
VCFLLSSNNKFVSLSLVRALVLFLAKVYPLSDRSGVNLKGTINTGNATTYVVGWLVVVIVFQTLLACLC